jgi:hypothetical protein
VSGFLLFCGLGLAAADLPQRDEYAYRFTLGVEQAAEYLAVDVPLEVYRAVTDPTLRDAGVYNADRQAVPRIFEHPQPPNNAIEQTTSLGLIPLHGALAAQHEQLRLLMQRDANSTTLSLDTSRTGTGDAPPTPPLAAYIVDLREFDQPFAALDFDWEGAEKGFIGTVTLEYSNDLQHWRRLAQATLADLQYEDTHIQQQRVKLERGAEDYLRVSWRDMPQGWRLKGINGIRSEQAPVVRDWLELTPVEVSNDQREYVFDAGGYPPSDRLSLLLPGDNVVVRATVSYRHEPKDNWRQVYQGVFYHASRAGNDVTSPAAAIGDTRAGQWRVHIDSGTVNGALRLKLGWRPDRLVFLAQGTPPFELVSGRALDRIEQFPQEALLGDRAIFRMLADSGQAGTASLGPREQLAGAAALVVGATRTWRVALVWIGLIGAVALVGWLVLSLLRDMKKPGGA